MTNAPEGPRTIVTELSTDWLFGGPIPRPGPEDGLYPEVVARFADAALDETGWERVTLPHTVTDLSWRSWNPSTWEKVWAYRRHIAVTDLPADSRVFLEFGAAMTAATVTFNGEVLGEHRGGYLPFSYEVTDVLAASGDNLLAVALDSRFTINVPPNAPASPVASYRRRRKPRCSAVRRRSTASGRTASAACRAIRGTARRRHRPAAGWPRAMPWYRDAAAP